MKRVAKHAVAAVMLVLRLAAPAVAQQGDLATVLYESLKRGDYAAALRLARPFADQGDAQAQYLIGTFYDGSPGVLQDYESAAKWYRKAAEQGYSSAQNNLAAMYESGKGVPQDYEAALKWYRKAANQGDADAQSNLASMYWHGKGVPQNYVMAHMWLNLSAANGNRDAAKLRDSLAKKMTPAQIAEAQKLAREWKPK